MVAQSQPAAQLMLSREDVERLLRDDSPDSRKNVLEKVAVHYNEQTLNAREQEIAEHIFRLLMRDMSLQVRATLADQVKANDQVPRDIMLHLAQDVDEVALPVLRESTVFSDADLVSIVEASHDMEKLLAISSRAHVSERVSGALVETNYAQVVTSLLSNDGASISTQDLTKIVTEFAEESGVIDALTQKPTLPLVVVERLISQASDAVAAELKEKYNIDTAQLEADATRMREALMMRLLEGDLSANEMEALVEQMWTNQSLTPSVLMTALCRGQHTFFSLGLARMANVPAANALRLIGDRGEHGFRGIYMKSGLPESMMGAMQVVVRAVQAMEEDDGAIPGTMLYANRLAERVINTVGDSNVEYIPYFIALIRNVRR